MHPEPFNPNSRLRASDADRDQAAAVLNAALAEGRLSVAEHSQRLDGLYEAKTHAEIAPLVDDLPSKSVVARPAQPTDLASQAKRRRQLIIAIFGGATRRGKWQVESKMTAFTMFGGATFDFREVDLPQREITLNCTAIFGGMEIIVPPEMRVVDSGIALFGGRDVGEGATQPDPNAPVLRLTGLTLFGGLGVKHKRRKPARG